MSEIMKPKEVASYLKMSILTVYKHARLGTIPGFRVGNSWRFYKEDIDAILRKSAKTEQMPAAGNE